MFHSHRTLNRPSRWLKAGSGVAALAAALTLVPASPAQAQEDALADPNLGRVSLDVGVDFATDYFFRGFPQENQGLIAQPWAEVGFSLYEGDGAINSLDAYVGVWNSLHTHKDLATEAPSNWYEADFYTGVTVGLFDDWEVGFVYTAYMYPGYDIDSINEVGLTLAYDDSELLGDFAMAPYVGFFFETDSGSSENRYFEVGFGPSFDLIESQDDGVGLALSIPVTVGLDMGEYYGDNTFGFFDIGAVVSTPLGFIPGDFGAWEAYAGVHYIRLGNQAAAAGAPDFGFPGITDGGKNHVYGTLGFSMSY
ncbi:MAG: hypothetical protein WD294_06285 [Phycisphaeraceae bacterium]